MSLAGKLQLGPGQSVSVIGAPAGIDLGDVPVAGSGDLDAADAAIVFCTDRQQLEGVTASVVAHATRDALTWVAYPKAGQLETDLNRDVVRELLEARGIQPVRQVAIDDVWSALRFRPA